MHMNPDIIKKMSKLRMIHMTKRDYNVDLFRILATILVIVLHVLGKGGILQKSTPDGTIYWAAWFIEISAYCAVNCFALISGYVMVNKTIKIKNIIGLWFQVLFYSLLLTSLFFVFIPETRTIMNLVVAFLPIVGKQWWYISSYFALFFFIPILNVAIGHISKKTYEKFLIVVLIGICVIDCVIPIDAFLFNDGYSTIWLIILYLLGAYIKKYDLKRKVPALNSILVFFAMILLTFLSKLIIHFATKKIFGDVKLDNTFISYTSITIVLASIFMFLFCLNIKISHVSKRAIKFFSPTTLGVYLIHVHPLVFQYIMEDAFISFSYKPLIVMVVCVFTATLAIFLLCSVIDLIRIQFFKLIKINKLCEFIDNKVTRLCLKVFKE